MCGWNIHGQLASSSIDNLTRPTRVIQLDSMIVKDVALGYGHSLFLTIQGEIFGCGFMDNGELIVDPQQLPFSVCNGKAKTWHLLKLDLPEPIEMFASGYFHGLAVSKTAIYVWGESPQTLKMNAFWRKRQNAKSKSDKNGKQSPNLSQQPDEKIDPSNSVLSNWQIPEENIHLSRDHFKFRRVTDWDLNQHPLKRVTAGYNHSAILTQEGEILTWGRSLDCQLGHGTKADKPVPTQLSGPLGIVWADVKCGKSCVIVSIL